MLWQVKTILALIFTVLKVKETKMFRLNFKLCKYLSFKKYGVAIFAYHSYSRDKTEGKDLLIDNN